MSTKLGKKLRARIGLLLIIIVGFGFLRVVSCENVEFNQGEILNYLNYNLARYNQIGLLDFAYTLDSYELLGVEAPNKTQILEYLDGIQSEEGTWTTGQNHYVPITAQFLMFYNRSGVKPAKSLEPFFATVDTWEKVNTHVNTYDSTNYWGGLWGYVTCYVVYKGEAPPWAGDFLNEVEVKFDTWAYSNHQRTHVIFNLNQLRVPVPRVDEVVNISLQQQREDGSWSHDLPQTAFMIGAFDLIRKQITINQSLIDTAISKGLNFIESCYKRIERQGKIYAGFALNPSEIYPSPWPTGLGVYSLLARARYLLNPESDIWLRWSIASANPRPTPTSSPSPSPSIVPRPSPSLSPSPSPSPSSSQQPIPTQKPQLPSSLSAEIIYLVAVGISFAVIVTLTFLLRRKRRPLAEEHTNT